MKMNQKKKLHNYNNIYKNKGLATKWMSLGNVTQVINFIFMLSLLEHEINRAYKW